MKLEMMSSAKLCQIIRELESDVARLEKMLTVAMNALTRISTDIKDGNLDDLDCNECVYFAKDKCGDAGCMEFFAKETLKKIQELREE